MAHQYSASYEWALRLKAGGCVLDYLQDLPRNFGGHRKTLFIEDVDGYMPPKVFEAYGDSRYVIPMRLRTEASGGTIIADWSFVSPWGHQIVWNCFPEAAVPPCDRPRYKDLFDFPLMSEVLDRKSFLKKGQSITGLLCGIAYDQSVPELDRSRHTALGELTVIDGNGVTNRKSITLTIERIAVKARVRVGRRRLITSDAAENNLISIQGDSPDCIETSADHADSSESTKANRQVASGVHGRALA